MAILKEQLSNITIIVPAYEPDEKLLSAISELEKYGFCDILVVNDGSSPACEEVFKKACEFNSVTLLTHEQNMGKGVALKTAFKHIIENKKDCLGTLTVDSDGQHLPKDVLALAEDMLNGTPHVVLGYRDFSLPFVPERSRKGNNITRNVFKKIFKMDIYDTQTGLRAIPAEYFNDMLETEGCRYEYENNMLITLKDNGIPFTQVPIETVYIEENKSSHFRPVKDSVRIYYHLFEKVIKYTANSILCVLIENIIQTLLHDALNFTGVLLEVVDFLPARFVSSVINYLINKKYVFKSKKATKTSLLRYYVLWVVQAIATLFLTVFIETALGKTEGFIYFLIITIVKTLIFFVSYFLQKKWVFSNKN